MNKQLHDNEGGNSENHDHDHAHAHDHDHVHEGVETPAGASHKRGAEGADANHDVSPDANRDVNPDANHDVNPDANRDVSPDANRKTNRGEPTGSIYIPPKGSLMAKMYGIIPMILFIGVTILFLLSLTSCAAKSPYKGAAFNTLNLTQFSPVYINAPVSSFESREFNDMQYRTLVDTFKKQGYNVVDNRGDATYEIYVNVVNIFTAKQFSSSIQRGLSLETAEQTPNRRTPPRKAYKAESVQPTNYTYVYMQSYVPISSTFQDRKVLVWEGSANVEQDDYKVNYQKTISQLVGEYGRELRRNDVKRR